MLTEEQRTMRVNFSAETEMPGTKVSRDQLQIICHRYYFASKFVSEKEVLEVGCGPSLGLGYLSKNAKRVVGGDLTQNSLRYAQKHYNGRVGLVSMDAHKLPFRDSCFDVVIAVATIIYLDLSIFFDECHRVLKKGGVLILNTPNKDIPNFQGSRLSKNYFRAPELFALINRHHFDAEFFGAFPILEKPQTETFIRAWGGKVLHMVPKERVIRKFIGNIMDGRNLILNAELDDELIKNSNVENIKLKHLPHNSLDFQHRILYVIGRSRESEKVQYEGGISL